MKVRYLRYIYIVTYKIRSTTNSGYNRMKIETTHHTQYRFLSTPQHNTQRITKREKKTFGLYAYQESAKYGKTERTRYYLHTISYIHTHTVNYGFPHTMICKRI